MKTTLLSVALFVAGISCFGQQLDNTFLKTFANNTLYADPLLTSLKNGNILITRGTDYFEVNGTTGDSLNTGTFKTDLSAIKSIVTDGDHIYLGGNGTGNAVLTKLDMNMDTVWNTHVLEASFSEGVAAILVDGTDIYVSGSIQSSTPFIAKLNPQGDTIWTKKIPQSTFSNLSSIIKLKDGSFFACGNLDDYPIGIKFDALGSIEWTYSEILFISFTKSAAFERVLASEIVMLARNKLIILDGRTGVKKSITSTNYDDFNDLKVVDDTVYFFGTHKTQQYGGNQEALVQVRNLNLDSLKSYTYTQNVVPTVSNAFTKGLLLGGNKFACTGRLRDSSNVPANEWKLIAAKFNDNQISVGVNQNSNFIESPVFPNPTSGIVYLGEVAINVNVFSLEGNQLVHKTGGNNSTVDLSDVAAGTYFVTWTNSSGELKRSTVVKN